MHNGMDLIAQIQQRSAQDDIVQFVQQLIQIAIEKNASDIHIESFTTHCRIRLRCDGLLYEIGKINKEIAERLITRLKLISNLDIAERRLPQDGRVQLSEQPIDIRINTCPVLSGEKIVLRLLDVQKQTLDLHELGLLPQQQDLLLTQLTQPNGLILVTGPTGSGKTITLYSALHYLNTNEKNIATAEDPVEIEIANINQVAVNTKIGLDFPTILRALLRQDPDVLMVGEIRDSETASMALQAAQTGHLVLSTLHTKHTLEALIRLQTMGVATYQLVDAIQLIIAQRLVRKLCQHCKVADLTTTTVTYRAHGCDHCHDGYLGRVGLFEVIRLDEKLKTAILAKTPIALITAQIEKSDSLFLWQVGLQKVKDGITSYAELARVLGHETITTM